MFNRGTIYQLGPVQPINILRKLGFKLGEVAR
jgi:hypothetical protein